MNFRYLCFAIMLAIIWMTRGDVPLAEEIASKDLAVTSQAEFESKLQSIMNEAKLVLGQTQTQIF